MSENTIHKHEGMWWFYDETSDRQGPFSSKEEARYELSKYNRWLKRKNKALSEADSKTKA